MVRKSHSVYNYYTGTRVMLRAVCLCCILPTSQCIIVTHDLVSSRDPRLDGLSLSIAFSIPHYQNVNPRHIHSDGIIIKGHNGHLHTPPTLVYNCPSRSEQQSNPNISNNHSSPQTNYINRTPLRNIKTLRCPWSSIIRKPTEIDGEFECLEGCYWRF